MTGGSGQIRWTAEGTVLPACKVVDASLFPVVPCANTNFPTLMDSRRDVCCGVIRIFRRCRRLGDRPYSLATDGQNIYVCQQGARIFSGR